jgi:hypothetical protein
MDSDDNEVLRVVFHRETEKAWLVSAEHADAQAWVPKSGCTLQPENPEPGDTCWLTVPRWLLGAGL